jgi:predicted small lipoprotein YifL
MNRRYTSYSSILGLTLVAIASLAGCGRHDAAPSNAPDAAVQARQQAQAAAKKIDNARQQMAEIPPPAKSRYMAIHTQESWGNPFLIVGSTNVTLRIVYPDQTHSSALPSAMLKPAKARRQEMEVRLSDLPDALGALPQEEWPYGRVVAVEEDPAETKANRLQVRRNVETTMQLLNNLGVVIYEWPTNGLQR